MKNKELELGKKEELEHSSTIKQIIKDVKDGKAKTIEYYSEMILND